MAERRGVRAVPPRLGLGVVWWPELDPLLRPGEGLVDFVELEPEAFWLSGGPPPGRGLRSVLAEAVAHIGLPKLLHGVGAPIGGSAPPPPGHSAVFAGDIEWIGPAWVSEHLSFSMFPHPSGRGAAPAGFLLPPQQSRGSAEAAASAIRARRSAYGSIPFAFETGVNYLPPRPGELADGEFAAAVAEAADCGILLISTTSSATSATAASPSPISAGPSRWSASGRCTQRAARNTRASDWTRTRAWPART